MTNAKQIIIGLTGSMGSGKEKLSKSFREKVLVCYLVFHCGERRAGVERKDMKVDGYRQFYEKKMALVFLPNAL